MGKKSSPPKAPNLGPLLQQQTQMANQQYAVAMEQLGISKDQLAWMKQNAAQEYEFAKQQADRMFGLSEQANKRDEETLAMNKAIAQRQMEAMDTQMGWAKEDRERWNSVYKPMQDQFIKEANEYDTPERREQAASQAMVDIQRQSEAQRTNADARLRSMGIDPSQVRSGSMMNQLAVVSAAQQAGAGNQARQETEDRGRALRAAAIDMGNGLPAQAMAAFAGSGNNANVALNASNSATQINQSQMGNQIAAAQAGMGFRSNALGQYGALTGTAAQWAGMAGNGFGQAGNMLGMAGNTINQDFANRLTRWDARRMQQQAWFDNSLKVAETASNFMSMAEGGAVPRRGRVHAAEGFSVNKSGAKSISSKNTSKSGMGRNRQMGGAYRSGFNIKDNIGSMETKDLGKDPAHSKGEGQMFGDPFDYDTSDVYKIGTMDFEGGNDSIVHRRVHVNSAKTGHKVDNWDKPQLGAPAEAKIRGYGGFQQGPQLATDFEAYMAEGGGPRYTGAIPRRQQRDTVPAMLGEGEYVVPEDVVRAVGIEKLDKLVAKYHRPGA